MSTRQFDNIYLNQSRAHGPLRIAESGLGWKTSDNATGGSKSSTTSQPFLLPSDEITAVHWSRAARGYQIRVLTRSKGVAQLDGFDVEDLNALKNTFKNNFDINLETREHSMRGWNWGEADFERSELVFNVAGKPMFELPYSEVSNTNMAGKSEIAVELALPTAGERSRFGDEIVEMRFFVPGTVAKEETEQNVKDEEGVKKENDEETKTENGENGEKKIKKENGEEEDTKSDVEEEEEEEEEEIEEVSAAEVFYESLKEKADIGMVAGESIVTFSDVLFLTPRGRYDIAMYESSFGLRGKTYDYKVQYKNVQRIFLLPKPDEIHNIMIIQLEPPLRQGQTRYPFLSLQFLKEEELEVELNVEDEEFQQKYADKLQKSYDEAAHQVVAKLFKGLTGRKVIFPSNFTSTHGQAGVACSLKANEGYLFPLDKCFLFMPKPTVYIPLTEISYITFSRGGDSSTSARTFDLSIQLKGKGQHQFSNINREERQGLEAYIKSKGIKLKNVGEDDRKLLAAALADESSGSDVEMASDQGSEESEDEDFQDNDDSDVAEEFDSNAESDEEMDENDGSEDEGPPTKKAKQ